MTSFNLEGHISKYSHIRGYGFNIRILGEQNSVHNIFFFLFYFWLCWVFVAAHGLSLLAANGGSSSLRYTGFSPQWLLLLWSTGSRCAGFSSCAMRAQ